MDHFCPSCGYNLYGIPEVRCPECGFRYDLRAVRSLGYGAHHQLTDTACFVTAWSIFAVGVVSAPLSLALRGGPGVALFTSLAVLLAGLVVRRVLYSSSRDEWLDDPMAFTLGAMACFLAATVAVQLPMFARIVATGIGAAVWWVQTGADRRYEFADQSIPESRRRECIRLHRLSWAMLCVATLFILAAWIEI